MYKWKHTILEKFMKKTTINKKLLFTKSKGAFTYLLKKKEEIINNFIEFNKSRKNPVILKLSKLEVTLEFKKIREALNELIIDDAFTIIDIFKESRINHYNFMNIKYPAYIIIIFEYIETESLNIYEHNKLGGSWVQDDFSLLEAIERRYTKFIAEYDNDDKIIKIIIKVLIYKKV